MLLLLAIAPGVLFGGGVYMILRRSLVKILVGLLLLGNAVNLLIFTSSRLTPGRPPLIPLGSAAPVMPYADPVPQALILTAIVIGFGIIAFAIVLIRRTYDETGSDDMDELRCTDLPCEPPSAEELS